MTDFRVLDNYPNPFNSSTIISYELPFNETVNVTIYDLLGKRVRTLFNGKQTSGFRSHAWDGESDEREIVPAGVYLYIVQAGNIIQSRKMLLLK